jgi:hypothetical protein
MDLKWQQKTRRPFDLRIIAYLLGFYEQMICVRAPVQRRNMMVMP